MAATTKLLQLRPKPSPIATKPTLIFFSSSSSSSSSSTATTPDPDDHSAKPNTTPESSQTQSPFSSYFSDVKASLKQKQQRSPQSLPRRKPFSFSSSSTPNPPTSPSKIASLEEIRKNLSEFRRLSAVPPPSPSASPPQSSQPISFQEIYQRKVLSKGEGSAPDASNTQGKLSFDVLRESLSQLSKTTARNQSERIDTLTDMSLSKFRESLKLKPTEPGARDTPIVVGGSDNLPLSVFGKELKEKEGGTSNEAMRTEFVKMYSYRELGAKLKLLRPERKENQKEWFSLEELNERLLKLREVEEKDRETSIVGFPFRELRASLVTLKKTDEEKAKKSTAQRLDILSQLGRTPSFMLSPPKEDLVEKYFHPDNMSASEKMKLELQKVRDEFKMSESDCGSARVQVAQLTTKIKHLSTVLLKKDKHSRKGLLAMVQRRKKLLKYLRRTDWDSYCLVLSKLGLRDNPVYKKDYPENKKKKKHARLKN